MSQVLCYTVRLYSHYLNNKTDRNQSLSEHKQGNDTVPICAAILTGPVVHFLFSYKLIPLKKQEKEMQRERATEWIPKHLALKHLTQTKSMTGYEGGLHSFTSTNLYKPTWAAVLSWGSGSNGGNQGRVWFTRQQPLGLFKKEEDRWGTASAAVLAHISMRIKPSTGLKRNATSTSLSKTSSGASSSWQCVDNLHHQQCCTSASLVLPPWHESSFPLLCPPTTKLKQNSCKMMDMMRRVQQKWQRGWVQRKQVFVYYRQTYLLFVKGKKILLILQTAAHQGQTSTEENPAPIPFQSAPTRSHIPT